MCVLTVRVWEVLHWLLRQLCVVFVYVYVFVQTGSAAPGDEEGEGGAGDNTALEAAAAQVCGPNPAEAGYT
jgi:hypothetical protein